MGEESFGRDLGGIWEASGRHQEASGRHMGGIWDTSGGVWETSEGDIWGVYGARGHPGAREAVVKSGVPKVVKNTENSWCWRSQGTVSLAFWSLHLHVDPKFAATYADRSVNEADVHSNHPLQNRQDPYR